MKKIIQKCFVFFFSLLCAFCLFINEFQSIQIIKAQSTIINDGNWSEQQENNETIYTKKCDIGQQAILTYANSMTFEEVSIDIKINQSWTSEDPNVGIQLCLEDGDMWFLDCSYLKNAVRIRYFPATGGEHWASFKENVGIKYQSWFNFKIIRSGATITAYIDNVAIVGYTSSNGAASFNNTILKISTWGTLISAKNFNVKEETIQQKEWDVPSCWKESNENEELVYTNDGTYQKITKNATSNGQFNTFSFDIRVNELLSSYDANVSALVFVNNQDHFMFEFNPAPSRSYARLRFFEGNSVEGVQLGQKGIELPLLDEWCNISVTFAEDYLIFYYNGQKVLSYFDTYGYNMKDCRVAISAWNTKASVKNLTVSTTEKDLTEAGYLDLEFKNDNAVFSFTANGGKLAYSDDSLVLDVSQQDASITSPKIDVTPGTPYSMRLSVRNTFAVRLKNNSLAKQLTLQFVTSKDETYDEVKQKTFAIEPNSDWKTYYFNISDVISCEHWKNKSLMKSCNDYLRGFKFIFNNASSGKVMIDAITFERENRLYEKAAESLECTADKNTKEVTVKGKALSKYIGKEVIIYQTDIQNYNELLEYTNNKIVAKTTVNQDQTFVAKFSFMQTEKINHLSSVFLAAVDGNKMDDVFRIENYQDFTENPYEFSLPGLRVNVTDSQFGAKGDGFTNDNIAIQKAIDYVNQQGGGTVVVPGDDSEYGKRYIISQINLKDNVELHIEENAILWQSQRYEDYDYGDYDPVYGHDVVIEGAAWTHAGPCWNKPLIYINEQENVKLTGSGTIRMQDTGTEWLDGNSYGWDSDIAANCNSLIHVHPIAAWKCNNLEIRDITIKRGAIWQLNVYNSTNTYIGNVNITEVSCINGDGISVAASSYMVIDRCSLYSNDDAIVLIANYNDPRGYGYAWWKSSPGEKFATNNLLVKNSNMFGGHGLTFITWGSSDSNLDNQEIHDITAYNNVLGGTSTAVGCWTDNPYYGSSGLGTYNQIEQDDYSPIRDIYIVDNIYTAPTIMATWDVNPPEVAPATNIITDCGMYSPNQFVNGNFDRIIRYNSEVEWTSGITYWSRDVLDNGEVGSVEVGEKETALLNSSTKVIQKDFAGYIKGNASLYQGLHLTFGGYEFNVDVKALSGETELFVKNAITNEEIASKKLTNTSKFTTEKINFVLEETCTIHIGLRHTGTNEEVVYLDNAKILLDNTVDIYKIEGQEYLWDFNSKELDLRIHSSGNSVSIIDNQLYVSDDAEYKVMLNNSSLMDQFEVKVDIKATKGSIVNAGIYLFASDVKETQDSITAYNVQVESTEDKSAYKISIFNFENKYVGSLITSDPFMANNDVINLRVVVKKSTIFVFVNNESTPILSYSLSKNLSGNVGLRTQMCATVFDNLYLKTNQYEYSGGDRSELNQLINSLTKFNQYGYTEDSYRSYVMALAEAKALPEKATQSQINAAHEKLAKAIENLIPLSQLDLKLNELMNYVAVMEKVDSNEYTEDSYQTLLGVILKVKDDYENKKITITNIEQYKEELFSAFDNLKIKEVEKAPAEECPTCDPCTPAPKKGCRGNITTSGLMLLSLGTLFLLKKKKK